MLKKIVNDVKITKNENKVIIKTTKNEVVLRKENVILKQRTILEKGHLKLNFDRFTNNTTLIGEILSGFVIDKTVVKITNNGTGILNIGTDEANGILMNATQNDLSEISDYEISNDIILTENTTIKLFLENNTATGQVIIYYS